MNDKQKNSGIIKKVVILGAIIVLVVLFKVFNLGDYLTLTYLKASQAKFNALYLQSKFTVIAVYMAIYIVVTALSLPGAAVMTLAGGALFGLLTGAVIVSFASTIGATLACFVSRFLLRDFVQNRFSDKLATINEGVEKEGGFYLFTMRLIPAFPFFVINLAMGLTKMPLFTYYFVSQIGMLPGTIVFVNAGKELSKIATLSGILSPSLIFSFALLGLFPLIIKKLMALYKSRTGNVQ
ncbi:TVP38/TMEM64 family protein [Thermodesulfobacteriota bacterium]